MTVCLRFWVTLAAAVALAVAASLFALRGVVWPAILGGVAAAAFLVSLFAQLHEEHGNNRNSP